MPRAIAVAVALLLATACATVGRPIDQAAVAQLKPGVTTRVEAERVFGPPQHQVVSGGGAVTLVWSYGESAFGPRKGQALTLRFGPDGRLVNDPSAIQSVTSTY